MVKRQVLVLGGEGGVCGTRNEPERVVIRAIAEEDHAELIAVGFLEPEDVRVELDGPLDVRDMEQDMADLARANRCRHDFLPRSSRSFVTYRMKGLTPSASLRLTVDSSLASRLPSRPPARPCYRPDLRSTGIGPDLLCGSEGL